MPPPQSWATSVISPQVERFDELAQVGDALRKAIGIVSRRRFVGQPAADVIDRHDAIAIRERQHQVAPIERPGGVSVDQKQHGSGALVDVVIAMAAEKHLARLKGIQSAPSFVCSHRVPIRFYRGGAADALP